MKLIGKSSIVNGKVYEYNFWIIYKRRIKLSQEARLEHKNELKQYRNCDLAQFANEALKQKSLILQKNRNRQHGKKHIKI